MKGCIQVYTGNGKGKTTAALGLAMRAVGAGKKVWAGQFVKGKLYSEIKFINEHMPGFDLIQFGTDCFIYKAPTQKDINAAREGLERSKKVIVSDEYDMIILDEVFIALFYGLFSKEELLIVLEQKPERTEIILTGRYAPQEIIEKADLVTEMKVVKHYYNEGIEAREGIEF